MIRVLFVCLGNICRSPMAEAVLRHQAAEAGLDEFIQVDSAGTGDWHIGKPPHEGTRMLLDGLGIRHEGMKARQVTAGDLDSFDYVICMDASNERNVRALREAAGSARLFRFMELVEGRQGEDVPDPYYTGNFQEVYDLVHTGCRALLAQIMRDHHLGRA
ncbi:low molecular weight phosphotyrosine protein phosphatase [Paenibacillus sambharensis]|uniref:protein-tyrosine-phosphatase n=1 Tax=Paenibacillus sambharensis TaxID=1803190 RepID=A0A2W1L170_9BACL|nr:low molecular weight protein-tyrosine-phosphatase [Paenibacillus sambharensis]PZD93678.1 low molecular weight phosphotyrosine protein phosphatase [Paenibacillus sambharensis]